MKTCELCHLSYVKRKTGGLKLFCGHDNLLVREDHCCTGFVPKPSVSVGLEGGKKGQYSDYWGGELTPSWVPAPRGLRGAKDAMRKPGSGGARKGAGRKKKTAKDVV